MAKTIRSVMVKQVPDPMPDASYLEQAGFEQRRAEFQAGNFGYIGIEAIAEVEAGGLIQTFHSSGLWGIEDDSDADYLKSVSIEELASLHDVLIEFGFAEDEILKMFPKL